MHAHVAVERQKNSSSPPAFQGKFIRIHFNVQGKLAGCDIETYLLEKSRITFQQEVRRVKSSFLPVLIKLTVLFQVERSYHIFYQMMQKAVPDLKKVCHLSDDIYDYHYVSQGKTSVPSIDDNEDLEFTHDAFSILHFSEEETFNIYKCVAAVMHMGELKFKQKGREEQCEPDDPDRAAKVGDLLGCDPEAMMKAYCKPKIRVGTEWVTKGQNIDQSTQSVAGIARGVYDRYEETFLACPAKQCNCPYESGSSASWWRSATSPWSTPP